MCEFQEVRWTAWSEAHIGRHNVVPAEVEDVLFGRPRMTAKGRDGTTLIFGRTRSGRYLLVVAVEEGQGGAFVVTSREMTEEERRTFRRRVR